MPPIVLALLLLIIGLTLIFLELFIPSAGVLGFLAVVALIGSVAYAYMKEGMAVGTIFLAAVVVLVPIAIGIAFRIWPHTPMGKRILLGAPDRGDPDEIEAASLVGLVGKRGISTSLLLPSGVVEIEGETYDVLALGGAIDRGTAIEVVEVEGTRVFVVEARDEEVAQAKPADEDDPYSKPLESLGIDPSEDPFA
ncbi:MAG: NfeD family protein [Pirellulaceae bacterium]